MKVSIVGLGLIGGSIALGLRKCSFASELIGVDLNANHAEEALRLNLVDRVEPMSSALQSDLVILAIPTDAIQAQLSGILDQISEKTVVVDLGSTKEGICSSVATHIKRGRYVAAHPIAGTENSGPNAAFAELYLNKTCIICDEEKSDKEALALVKKMFSSLWMNLVFMSAKEHDTHIAYVSHLSHVTSFALGSAVLEIEKDEKNIFNMAGSGFASTVRLAKSSPEMWAPIFMQNKENVLEAIEAYEAHLAQFKTLLKSGDQEALNAYMARVNVIRKVLEKS